MMDGRELQSCFQAWNTAMQTRNLSTAKKLRRTARGDKKMVKLKTKGWQNYV